ncbi:MAG: alpha/beta hydrolase family protein [Steroidobacteraceae bacterium]
MFNMVKGLGAGLVVALLAACGSNTGTSAVATSTARGTLDVNPPLRILSFDAPGLQAELASNSTAAALLPLWGNPTCGVDVYYVKFWTVGGAGETTESSGALMVPTGAAPPCTGPRPIVLYAHGTNPDQTLNLANLVNPNDSEGVSIAATFAAQGFIVVAPNFAGYDISTLGYHPYLNAVQNSGEMIDMLAAARTALPNTMSSATSDSGQLLITGYSAGGYVAMATQRAIEAAGGKVTAAAPMSGPYALEALLDSVFLGAVDAYSTVNGTMLIDGYQHAYGNIYTTATDVINPQYATGIGNLLPSATPIDTILAEGLLPEFALFDNVTPTVTIPGSAVLSAELTAALAVPSNPANPFTPLFDLGFGASYLINNDYRVSYAINAASFIDGAGPLAPTGSPPTVAAIPAMIPSPTLAPAFYLRQALNTNDLRNPPWAPHSPTLLCGGDSDPVVYFSVDTGTMQKFWSALPAGALTVLDINATPAGPFAELQGAFQAHQASVLAFYESAAGGSLSPTAAELQVVAQTHQAEQPFCSVAARSFFTEILGG